MMTVIPIFCLYSHPYCPPFEQINSFSNLIYFILCGMSTTRILRALRFRKYFMKMEDEVQRFLATMCLYIVVMILFPRCFYSFLLLYLI